MLEWPRCQTWLRNKANITINRLSSLCFYHLHVYFVIYCQFTVASQQQQQLSVQQASH